MHANGPLTHWTQEERAAALGSGFLRAAVLGERGVELLA